MDAPPEERADGEYDRARPDHDAGHGDDAVYAATLDHKIGHFLLEYREIRLALEHRANLAPIQRAIGLRARGAHRGTLARVQRAELDARAIDRARHRAAEGVDLAHEVALADAADRRIAAHRPERLDGLRKEERAPAHPGRGECGLGAGVAATDHDDVEDFHRLQRLDAKPPLYGILRG